MICLFTHDDLDGVGCAILTRFAYPDARVIHYCSYRIINHEVNASPDQLQAPTRIIISDLSVDESTALRLDSYDVAMFGRHPIQVHRPWMAADTSGEVCGTSRMAKALLPDAGTAEAAGNRRQLHFT